MFNGIIRTFRTVIQSSDAYALFFILRAKRRHRRFADAPIFNLTLPYFCENVSASGYCIEKWDGSKWVQIKRYTSNANVTYTATGLKANTAYKFRIRAYKTIGNVNEYSAYSAVVTARTKK